jgi:hypothetical protein
MIECITGARDQILKAGQTKEIKITTIDPATNCAFRHTTVRTLEYPVPGGPARIQVRIRGQTFFRGSTAGGTYVERMAMLSRHLEADPHFKESDFYIIEDQFKTNVAISVGVIIGHIGAARAREVVVRTKRSGNQEPDGMPYAILTIPCKFKRHAINFWEDCPPGKLPEDQIKRLACAAAAKICARDGDQATIRLMDETAKNDDIADVVCHEYAIRAFLEDPDVLGTRAGAKKAAR